MEHEAKARIEDGWLVCGYCGKRLAQIDGQNIKIMCRGSRYVGNHVVIFGNGGDSDGCNLSCDCNGASLN